LGSLDLIFFLVRDASSGKIPLLDSQTPYPPSESQSSYFLLGIDPKPRLQQQIYQLGGWETSSIPISAMTELLSSAKI